MSRSAGSSFRAVARARCFGDSASGHFLRRIERQETAGLIRAFGGSSWLTAKFKFNYNNTLR